MRRNTDKRGAEEKKYVAIAKMLLSENVKSMISYERGEEVDHVDGRIGTLLTEPKNMVVLSRREHDVKTRSKDSKERCEIIRAERMALHLKYGKDYIVYLLSFKEKPKTMVDYLDEFVPGWEKENP